MRRLRNARERAHAAAQQTRGEAFTFVRTRRGNLVEVRVLPDGATVYTLVDASGRRTHKPHTPLTSRRPTATGVAVAAACVSTVGFLMELVL